MKVLLIWDSIGSILGLEGIGTLDAILGFIVCYNEKEKLVEWQREYVSCLIAELVEQLSGMWHVCATFPGARGDSTQSGG